MPDGTKQETEWIALGSFNWQRRATRTEALRALLDAIGGDRARRTTVTIVEVPAGAQVDQMGNVRWDTPEGWDEMTEDERAAHCKLPEPEVIEPDDLPAPEWIVEERVNRGRWELYDFAYSEATAKATAAEMTEEVEAIGWASHKFRVRKAEPGELE